MIEDSNFLKKLFKSTYVTHHEKENQIGLDRDFFLKIENLSKRIQTNTAELIKMKSSILKGKYEPKKKNELDVIEVLRYLNDTFSRKESERE